MNSIAKELNAVLEGSAAAGLLSDFGKRMYFPKGIVAQSAEASQKATRYNATVGMATQNGNPLFLPSVFEMFSHVSEKDVFTYAPTAGDPNLRKVWKREMEKKNPSLKGKETSVPVVTSGLTHGIFVAAELFLDENDVILVPDMFWGNYRLIIEETRKAKIQQFPFYSEDGKLNLEALEEAIYTTGSDKVSIILNFPNNPTGYSPSKDEALAVTAILTKAAEKGKRVMVITDDAYFGLFYEEDTCKESLFAYLADAHENLLAVKVDGATKEELVWGFRVGFITYGAKGMTAEQYEALVKKTMGAVRGSISNCSKPAQTLLLKGLESGTYEAEKQAALEILRERYLKVQEVLARFAKKETLIPLPFNSGYFMAFTCAGSAEALRLYLLETYNIGTISIQDTYLRIAYSSVNVEQIEDLFTLLFQAAEEVWR